MAVQAPPSSLPSAPPVPQGLDPALTAYLMQFTLWCSNQFASRLVSNSALPGVMLQANDTAAGATPAVFHLQVKTDGTVVAAPMPLGSGKP
jgi:hypothetical protein